MKMYKYLSFVCILSLANEYNSVVVVDGLSNGVTLQKPTPSAALADRKGQVWEDGMAKKSVYADDGMTPIDLPNFHVLYDEIQRVSPLAASVIQRQQPMGPASRRGFAACRSDDKKDSEFALPWKVTEQHSSASKRNPVLQVAKVEHYQDRHAPLLRFRSTMKGPCVGSYFADFMTVLSERKKWDTSIEQVYTAHGVTTELPAVNRYIQQAQGDLDFGVCSQFGIGYCQTKASFGISSREQLTACGVQDFKEDGSCIIWGAECSPTLHDHLLPAGPRHTRAQSNIFSATLVPVAADTFDVEYSLQLDIGGRLPLWLTTPVVTETVRSLFQCASQHFSGKDGHLEQYLRDRQHVQESLLTTRQQSLLMTP